MEDIIPDYDKNYLQNKGAVALAFSKTAVGKLLFYDTIKAYEKRYDTLTLIFSV